MLTKHNDAALALIALRDRTTKFMEKIRYQKFDAETESRRDNVMDEIISSYDAVPPQGLSTVFPELMVAAKRAARKAK